MNPGIKDSNCSKSRLTTVPLDVYEPINSDELFGSGADDGKQTAFTVSKHDCKQLCGRKCVAECDPYCMTCWEALKLQLVEQQARLTHHPQSDLQPACIPSSPMAGCEKPVSNLTLPLLPCSTEQGDGTKASPMSHDESQHGKNPESPPSETRSRKGDPADRKRPEKKKIRLKFVPQDKADFNEVCSSGVIICLWNKHNIDNGTHPLFEKIGEVVKTSRLKEFRTCLQHDQVVATDGGKSTAALVVHCKYHPVTRRQVASALVRCLEFVEASKKIKTIFPVKFSDDLCDNLDVVIPATMYAISNIQKSTNYTQNLDKFYLYVANESIATQCKQKHREILDDKKSRQRSQSRRQKCHKCKTNPASKLQPLPLSGSCKDECAVFCIQCLQEGRHNQLDCPNHGPCFSPIGHQNTFALLVAGYYATRENVAKLFCC
ncbi:uncharacterized protein LOC124291087 [Haliotis rubra]|uniref:uncharacterized protein LOC124291087 n=1 Tax=Haliotis rubra TaxID=36100 RepID=UPI001EE58030|nr:uncharacterized protein LOC124291087 [Haliotis rubra]